MEFKMQLIYTTESIAWFENDARPQELPLSRYGVYDSIK